MTSQQAIDRRKKSRKLDDRLSLQAGEIADLLDGPGDSEDLLEETEDLPTEAP